MRPVDLDTFVGQSHLVGPGRLLRSAIEKDRLFSMILWGPPGTGKTTLAKIIGARNSAYFVSFSAVLSGVKDIKKVIEEAQREQRYHQRKTILFVDELHRFNKAQQDAFLPHVEKGLIILIGATTENPSFEVNSALLSRCKVFVLKELSPSDLKGILTCALVNKEKGLGNESVEIDETMIDIICQSAYGDARVALNNLEVLVQACPLDSRGVKVITAQWVEESMEIKPLLYDKEGEEHYNLISAFHKSLRGSDPDAALYWLARMLEAGEYPLYIARRMVRFASEDIGNADPMALQVALAAKEAFHFIGLPEGKLSLAQAAIYLATSPKSNSLYRAYEEAEKEVSRSGPLPVPLYLRNAPTSMMKGMGYGRGYRYPHDDPDKIVEQDYLPEGIRKRTFYRPTTEGMEKKIKERLERWQALRSKKRHQRRP
jgi:putative ATPase